MRQIAEDEDEHLSYFEDLMIEKRVRPTLMSPLWKLGGFSLGAFTAILGKDYVMACTEAVETIIEVKNNEKERFLNESADLLFHLLILLKAKGVKFDDVISVLKSRN